VPGAGSGLRGGGESAQCQIMMNFAELASVPSEHPAPLLISYGWPWLLTWPDVSKFLSLILSIDGRR